MKTIKPGTKISLGFIPRSLRGQINEQFKTFCGLYDEGYIVTIDSDRIDEFWDSFPGLSEQIYRENQRDLLVI